MPRPQRPPASRPPTSAGQRRSSMPMSTASRSPLPMGLAEYKGSGTINGSGSYSFMLTARDGALYSAGTQDGFRIKIVDQSGGVVYDNMAATATNDNPTSGNTQALGGGSVIVHANGN